MRFENSFEVPVPPEEAWPILLDIERIVPCMPGTELVEKIDENTYRGKMSVALGPMRLAMNGIAEFVNIDPEQKTVSVKASGTDSKGKGGVSALADMHLKESEMGSIVEIVTNLNLSGSIAQYGRGVGLIKGVADQMIQEFTARLEADILEPGSRDNKERQPNEPVSGFKLLFRMIKGWLRKPAR
jgi:uncharacterized protein